MTAVVRDYALALVCILCVDPSARLRSADLGRARLVQAQQRSPRRSARHRRCGRGGVRPSHARARGGPVSRTLLGTTARAARGGAAGTDGGPAAGRRRPRALRALAGPVRAALRRRRTAGRASRPAHLCLLRRPPRVVLALRGRGLARRAGPERHVHRCIRLAPRNRAAARDACRARRAGPRRLDAAPRSQRRSRHRRRDHAHHQAGSGTPR